MDIQSSVFWDTTREKEPQRKGGVCVCVSHCQENRERNTHVHYLACLPVKLGETQFFLHGNLVYQALHRLSYLHITVLWLKAFFWFMGVMLVYLPCKVIFGDIHLRQDRIFMYSFMLSSHFYRTPGGPSYRPTSFHMIKNSLMINWCFPTVWLKAMHTYTQKKQKR